MDTQIIKIDPENLGRSAELAASFIKRGEIVAIPTETVYGLAANAYDDAAVRRIFEVKGRPQDNPLIVHISDYVMLGNIAHTITDEAAALARAFWPGPLTMVFPKTEAISDIVSCGLDTVAVRMPSNPVAAEVIKRAELPIAAPSANLSGRPSTTSARHVITDLDGKIPLILDGGESAIGVESTVLSMTGDVPVILRPGIISLEEIREIAPNAELSPSVFKEPPRGEKVESPGMKYKHYAPNAEVVVIKSTLAKFVKYVRGQKGENLYAMCFEGEQEDIPIPSVAYGIKKDGRSQAKRLFNVLRTLDDCGAEKIYVRAPLDTGESAAVFNRLLRAAGFNILEL